MKGMLFIIFALFIDGLQAGISFGLAFIAANFGTIGGITGGCVAGKAIAGQVGCWVGGIALGAFGSFLNAHLAIGLVPVGIVLGFAINICLSATLGAGLVLLLGMDGMFYPKYIFGGGLGELLPGFDNLPAWTATTVLCLLKKKRESGGRSAALFGGAADIGNIVTSASPGTLPGRVAGAVLGMPQKTANISPEGQERATEAPAKTRVVPELKNIDGIKAPRPVDNALYAQTA